MKLEELCILESEAGVIATLIHNPDFAFYSEHLLPGHFTEKTNACVYLAITGLVKKGISVIDPYNIIEFLNSSEATRKFADIITVDRLNELIEMSDALAIQTFEEYKMLVPEK